MHQLTLSEQNVNNMMLKRFYDKSIKRCFFKKIQTELDSILQVSKRGTINFTTKKLKK